MEQRMQASNVKKLIEDELAGRKHIRNSHGVTLERCLVEPRRATIWDMVDNATLEGWLVLEENPGTKEGYVVTYIDARQPFALAYWRKNKLVLMYLCATFISAVENM